MAIKRNCTYHISEDRLDRAMYIMETIGIGEIIKEEKSYNEKGIIWQCLTNTGVILILSEDKKMCITLYIASQARVSALYKGNTPSWMFKIVKKNKIYQEMQNKIRM